MSRKRKQYSPEFKSKIAIACIRGDKTTAELATQHEIHPTQINTWKRELLEKASTLFDNGKSADKHNLIPRLRMMNSTARLAS